MCLLQVAMSLFIFSAVHCAEERFYDLFFHLQVEPNSTCYAHEYLPSKEYVEYTGKAFGFGQYALLPLELYLESQEDGTKTLVCILDFSSASHVGECQWEKSVKKSPKVEYEIIIKIVAGRGINNTRFLGIQRAALDHANYVTNAIRVHPVPEFTLRIDGRKQNIHACEFVETSKSLLPVEFCVNFLKHPNISLSPVNEPTPSVAQDCVARNFSLASVGSFKIVATYVDECCQYGSFTCLIKKKEISQSGHSRFWLIIVVPVLVAIAILAYGGYWMYIKIEADRNARTRKLKKLEKLKEADEKVKKDKQFAGAIFEVYTPAPETIASSSCSTSERRPRQRRMNMLLKEISDSSILSIST